VLYRLFNLCVSIYNESEKQKVTKEKKVGVAGLQPNTYLHYNILQ